MNLFNFVTRGAGNRELQLHLHGSHEADYENPGETFAAGQRNILRLFYKRACDRESAIYSTIY